MPYIKVERDEYDRSGNTKFDCKLCDFHIPSGGCHNNKTIMTRHLNEVHGDEWKKTIVQKEKFMRELESFRETLKEKYPLALRYVGDLFKSLPLPPRRMWKCDKCGRVISPHEKDYHNNNANLYCKPKEESPNSSVSGQEKVK